MADWSHGLASRSACVVVVSSFFWAFWKRFWSDLLFQSRHFSANVCEKAYGAGSDSVWNCERIAERLLVVWLASLILVFPVLLGTFRFCPYQVVALSLGISEDANLFWSQAHFSGDILNNGLRRYLRMSLILGVGSFVFFPHPISSSNCVQIGIVLKLLTKALNPVTDQFRPLTVSCGPWLWKQRWMQAVVLKDGQLFLHNGRLENNLAFKRLIYLQTVLLYLPSLKSGSCFNGNHI